MRTTAFAFAALVAIAGAANAQPQPAVEHTPRTCVVGGEMPVFNVAVNHQGTIRAFFRRVGNTDWCSVDGENHGPLSVATLPKFDTGEEFEYYFVLIDQKKIIAKSPQIYHVRAQSFCDAPFSRHNTLMTMQCLPPGSNPIATSMGAGFAVTGNDPRPVSPDRPSQAQARGTSKQ
jgi:hypothetical protein